MDFWIDTLGDNGGWQPARSWGQFEEDWDRAKPGIAAKLTVDRPLTPRAFGRLDA